MPSIPESAMNRPLTLFDGVRYYFNTHLDEWVSYSDLYFFLDTTSHPFPREYSKRSIHTFVQNLLKIHLLQREDSTGLFLCPQFLSVSFSGWDLQRLANPGSSEEFLEVVDKIRSKDSDFRLSAVLYAMWAVKVPDSSFSTTRVDTFRPVSIDAKGGSIIFQLKCHLASDLLDVCALYDVSVPLSDKEVAMVVRSFYRRMLSEEVELSVPYFGFLYDGVGVLRLLPVPVLLELVEGHPYEEVSPSFLGLPREEARERSGRSVLRRFCDRLNKIFR